MRIIKLPFKVKKPILACGADLKGAFAIAKGCKTFLFDGFGDLGDPDNLAKYEKSVWAGIKKLGTKSLVVACDLHPGYFSTRFAEHLQLKAYSLKLCHVQHHEAHIASAIVDNDIRGDVIGVAFDGTGYGSDGNIWGGEFLVGNLNKLTRTAHLEYVPMPGADAAIREPWRMAASYLYYAGGKKNLTSRLGRNYSSSEVEKHNFGLARKIKIPHRSDLRVLLAMIDKRINSPLTSSAGRLFDAAGSLILGKARVSKEAELPIELERLISSKKCGSYKFRFRSNGNGVIIDTKKIMKGVVKDLSNKVERQEVSCKFHNAMADIIAGTVQDLSKKFKVKQVVLSGGVFQNRYLTARAVRLLTENRIKVYTHSNIATNDSGIPLGQIAIANALNREILYA